MAFVVLDTDVASLLIKDRVPESLNARLVGYEPCLTFVTVGELIRWAEKRNLGARRRAELTGWIDQQPLLPWDVKTARRWGRMMAAADARGCTLPRNDSWIAACCLQAGLPLATSNVKDFIDLVEHEGLRLITA